MSFLQEWLSLYRLSKEEITKLCKKIKFTKGQTCIKPPDQKAVTRGESQVRGAGNLQKFRRLRNLQVAKFCNLKIFARLLLQSLINLLRNSSELIMGLRVQLRLNVFKSN